MGNVLAGVGVLVVYVTIAFFAYKIGRAHGRSEHNHRERLPDDIEDDAKVVPLLRRRKW